MPTRMQLVLLAAFGSLVILIGLAGYETLRRAGVLFDQISGVQDSYQHAERILDAIQVEVHLSGVLVRDYLLDPSHLTADLYRKQLLGLRGGIGPKLAALRKLPGLERNPELEQLESELDGYWDSLEPLFQWTPAQKQALSARFLRQSVLPRRDAALAMAHEARKLNDKHRAQRQAELQRAREQFRRQLLRSVFVAVLLGLAIAFASLYQFYRLESRATRQRELTARAEAELRRLSQQLVRAQEEERKAISRELHDQVGQMLTALRVELRNLENVRGENGERFLEVLGAAREVTDETLRTVRHMALGLRPSMLDDLGLGPAVEWQAREFSRRHGVPVTVVLEGPLDLLPESHRICIYRVVQEALTNCARHARASAIRVVIHGAPGKAMLLVQDDGAGFDPAGAGSRGLGMIGIEERVRELGGWVEWNSQPERGTLLRAEIPVSPPGGVDLGARELRSA